MKSDIIWNLFFVWLHLDQYLISISDQDSLSFQKEKQNSYQTAYPDLWPLDKAFSPHSELFSLFLWTPEMVCGLGKNLSRWAADCDLQLACSRQPLSQSFKFQFLPELQPVVSAASEGYSLAVCFVVVLFQEQLDWKKRLVIINIQWCLFGGNPPVTFISSWVQSAPLEEKPLINNLYTLEVTSLPLPLELFPALLWCRPSPPVSNCFQPFPSTLRRKWKERK